MVSQRRFRYVSIFSAMALAGILFVEKTAYAQPALQSKTGESVAVELVNDAQKTSYSVGTKYGEGLRRDLGDLDLESFIAGLRDSFGGKSLKLSNEEVSKVITVYQQKKIQESKEKQQAAAKTNKDKGDQFLVENKKQKDIVTTQSGLQYQILKEGSGVVPALDSVVKVHYRGTLVDGTVFDSSIDRGEPVSFPVNGVIKGWTEALQLMKVGSKWKLFIPSELAYGAQGAGGAIGPNETLIFEVELLEIGS